MRDHTDIDLAEKLATGENLPLTVVQEIDHLRGSQGFPERTIGPNNPYSPQTIDWNDAVNQISSWSVAGTIQPIDRRFEDLIRRHASQPDSPKKLTREELLRYEKWGKARIVDLSRHIGIDPSNFLEHLRGKLFEGVPSAQEKSDSLIRTLFKREPSESEFLPVSLPYKYLATSIMTIENPGRRRVVEAMLAKPGRFLGLARGYGLIASG
ncbi:MAG: hypothetical protein ACD_37C00279G0002 [uncultured bacterium]|nr:MAG: hypothetical protein ACD_37C00279G0002 [uncultured bacterium]